MKEFREAATRVLITTDVWARGLDVQQASPTQLLSGFLMFQKRSSAKFLFNQLLEDFKILQKYVEVFKMLIQMIMDMELELHPTSVPMMFINLMISHFVLCFGLGILGD